MVYKATKSVTGSSSAAATTAKDMDISMASVRQPVHAVESVQEIMTQGHVRLQHISASTALGKVGQTLVTLPTLQSVQYL